MDIQAFLKLYPPFDALDDAQIERIVRATRIEFHPAGEVILLQGGPPARAMYVIRKGAVELVDGEQVIDVLFEGEVFGHTSMLSTMTPSFTCRVHEDALVYLIDRDEAESALGTHTGLAFLSSSLRRRVIRALEGLEHEVVDPWQTRVGSLVRRPPVTAPPSATVREAAELMNRERVSAVLIEGRNGFGILTDRDLRSRVLSPGRSPETPVAEVMTEPVLTVAEGTMFAEVTAFMLERGVHHVPVTDAAGTVVGVVTDVDLMALERKAPFVLKVDIERASTPEEVVRAGRRLPDAVRTLVHANVDPVDVGHAVAVTVDALTRRFVELAIHEYGDPPCPWAWLALGSEARQEQAPLTDQDNAMVIDPGHTPPSMVDPYFERLAVFVNEHLERAGFPRCKAGVIASNEEWRHTPREWGLRFRRWIGQSTWMHGALSAITFDYRSVLGSLEIGPIFDEIIRRASASEPFVRRLARSALEDRPPTGFGRDTVIGHRGTAGTLDVKQGGITPITSLARVYSIKAGLSENRTLRRLHEAEQRGMIEAETRRGLEEAFRLLWQTRLEHEVGLLDRGEPLDDLVDPKQLGPLSRHGLKDAFRLIGRAQGDLARTLQIRR